LLTPDSTTLDPDDLEQDSKVFETNCLRTDFVERPKLDQSKLSAKTKVFNSTRVNARTPRAR
jgi:hypothetical protein